MKGFAPGGEADRGGFVVATGAASRRASAPSSASAPEMTTVSKPNKKPASAAIKEILSILEFMGKKFRGWFTVSWMSEPARYGYTP